ncbi:MAG: hypothetical protein WBG80_03765 [Bacteroidota bacterium]
MNARLVVLFTIILAIGTPSTSQTEEGLWTFQPRVAIGKLLPGSSIEAPEYSILTEFFAPVSGVNDFRYAGTALDLSVRAFPAELGWVALTLGGGLTWFYRGDDTAVDYIRQASDGVGEQLSPGDFIVFPLSLGVQLVYPGLQRTDFMLFAGLEGTVNFISGDIPIDQQVKGGYRVVAGFAVKVFEVGLRYEAFSDMRNLGVYLGFRLNPFEIGRSSKESG